MSKPKAGAGLILAAAIVLSLAGLAGFVLLFARDFNVYWLILSPVIIALYQLPAVYAFWLYRKRRAAGAGRGEAEKRAHGPDQS